MHKVWLSYVIEVVRDMQLLHFWNVVLSGMAAAIFVGSSEFESQLRIVKALCIK